MNKSECRLEVLRLLIPVSAVASLQHTPTLIEKADELVDWIDPQENVILPKKPSQGQQVKAKPSKAKPKPTPKQG